MEKPNKDNTLYLPIKQVYFDQIVSGEKKEEFREIKEGVTANRYLLKSNGLNSYELTPECTSPHKKYYIDDYNGGRFPFMPRPYKYLSLAVGYAKERDTAIVEVAGFRFEPHMVRKDREGRPVFCFWVIVFILGKVIEVHRK